MSRGLFLSVLLCLAPSTVPAQTPTCDRLQGADQSLAQRLFDSEYLYDCCDDTIAGCLAVESPCALAVRLADNICARIANGQDEARIRRGLSRRARSMVGGGARAEVDLTGAPIMGASDAPVTMVVYACARCPYCSRLIPALHEAISAGALRGQARMVFRTFPIRGHEGSTEAGLGFAAATLMDGFWPYLLYAYGHFDDFSPEIQPEWALAAGLDQEEFVSRVADPATREILVMSKKEGLVNGVEETPTIFLNGRRWVGDLEIDELIDAVAEEADRVRGKQ